MSKQQVIVFNILLSIIMGILVSFSFTLVKIVFLAKLGFGNVFLSVFLQGCLIAIVVGIVVSTVFVPVIMKKVMAMK